VNTEHEINERSYGIIPVAFRFWGLSLLLVQHRSGAWLFPKGKAEEGETPHQAAQRELKEETNLDIERWLDFGPFKEQYEFFRKGEKISKEVLYFPAFVQGEIALQHEELRSARWERVEAVPSAVTFPEMKKIAEEVCAWLLHRE
jgi:8-oxo-dGTP pyrophosphatase MutT (NUDIX family)